MGSIDNFLDWILYGFGNCENTNWSNEPVEVIRHWEDHFKKAFSDMIFYPRDYFTQFLAQYTSTLSKKHTSCFPTPMQIAVTMAEINFMDCKDITASVIDPCSGAGNLLLAASNYSINLYATDIDKTMLKGLIIQGYLYVPWLVMIPDNMRKLINKSKSPVAK